MNLLQEIKHPLDVKYAIFSISYVAFWAVWTSGLQFKQSITIVLLQVIGVICIYYFGIVGRRRGRINAFVVPMILILPVPLSVSYFIFDIGTDRAQFLVFFMPGVWLLQFLPSLALAMLFTLWTRNDV
jgi:hypothetical protein